MEEETEEEGHTTTKLDICCFLSSPFLVQNDFRSRPLGSTGARGVIHLASKIHLSQNEIHDWKIDCSEIVTLCKGRPKWKQEMPLSMKAGLVIMVFWSINLMGITNLCDVRRMFHVE